MPAATPNPPELEGATVAVAVSGSSPEIFGVETAPTEMSEDASARLRVSDVAAATTPAALSFGTCGARLAVSRPLPPFVCAQYQRRVCKAPQIRVRELGEWHGEILNPKF